ncbi:MAG: TonB-dependent receptor [Deltaproteobacteria bacterium]|jgi:vitamin B12 transporter|nr:TonB-dependent receptor [Deltaproteobacteria bacterium]
MLEHYFKGLVLCVSRFIFLSILLALILFSYRTEEAIAQVTADAGSFIDAIVVTASRVEERLRGVSTSVTVIDQEEIERYDAPDMGTLLRQYGIQLGEMGIGSSVIKMRGFGTYSSPNGTGDIVLLIDGRRTGNENPVMMPLDNIERIEIIRGGAAVQYGSDAHGGVINLITRRGTDKTRIVVSQAVGSFDKLVSKFAASGKFNNFDYSLAFGYSSSGDYTFPPNEVTYRQTKVYHKYINSANLGYSFNENHSLRFIITGAQGLYGNPSYQIPLHSDGSYWFDGIGANTTNGQESTTYRKNQSFDLIYQGNIPQVDLNILLRYYWGKTIYETNDDRRSPNELWAFYDNRFKGVNAIFSWNYNFLHLIAGFDYFSQHYFQDVYKNRALSSYAKFPSSADDTGAYLIAKVDLLDERLWFNAGVRYDKYTLTNVLDTNPNRNQGRSQSQNITHVSPAFGISFLVTDWLKLRFNFADTFKVPTPRQFVYDSFSGTTHAVGNSNLKPEMAKSWEFGFDFDRYDINLSATYFMTNYKDKISSYTVGTEVINGVTYTISSYRNDPGTTKFTGIELYADWDIGASLDWGFELRPYINFTKLFDYHSATGAPETLISNLNLNYGLVFSSLDFDLMASLDFTYYGIQYPSVTATSIREGRDRPFGKYNVMDFHLTKGLFELADYGKISLKVDIYNITDEFYMSSNTFPSAGTNFLVTLKYDY